MKKRENKGGRGGEVKARLHTVHLLLFLSFLWWRSPFFLKTTFFFHFLLFFLLTVKRGVNFPTVIFFIIIIFSCHVFVMANLDLLALVSVSENNNPKVASSPPCLRRRAERYLERL